MKGKYGFCEQGVPLLHDAEGSYIWVGQKKHNGASFWCLCKPKHMHLFQIMWSGAEGLLPYPAAGTGEDSSTGPGILTFTTCFSYAPSKNHVKPWVSPIQGNKATSRITSPAGRGVRQCHPTLCSPVRLISKVNKAFPLCAACANRWHYLTLQLFLQNTTITHCKYSWNRHLLPFLLPGNLQIFVLLVWNSTAATNSADVGNTHHVLLPQIWKVPFPPPWAQFCDQQAHFSAS